MEKIIGALILCAAIYGTHGCIAEMNSPEFKAEQAMREKSCATPRLVAETDGIKLYAINFPESECRGRAVYFSKSGTKTTHTERHGKVSSTYDDDVSNSEAK